MCALSFQERGSNRNHKECQNPAEYNIVVPCDGLHCYWVDELTADETSVCSDVVDSDGTAAKRVWEDLCGVGKGEWGPGNVVEEVINEDKYQHRVSKSLVMSFRKLGVQNCPRNVRAEHTGGGDQEKTTATYTID